MYRELLWGRIPDIEPSSAACIEDTDDSEIEEMEDPNSPSSDTVPAQPSAAVDEPVASSSAGGPHTESSARDHRQAEGMPPGTNTHKRGYAEMTGTLEGTNEDSDSEDPQWKRRKATAETPPELTTE